jgi:hypothetical protein
MELYAQLENIAHYRRLIADSMFDLVRDQRRHAMLLTLLAAELAKDIQLQSAPK